MKCFRLKLLFGLLLVFAFVLSGVEFCVKLIRDGVTDQALMCQDTIYRLDKANPKFREILDNLANKESTRLDKNFAKWGEFAKNLQFLPLVWADEGPQPPLANGADKPAALSAMEPKVAVWVNGKPLYYEEVYPGFLNVVAAGQWPQVKLIRDEVIDQELMYQDAIYKLERGNPKTLEKIKKLANDEYKKELARMGRSEADLGEHARILQRVTERNFIATEYAKSMITYPGNRWRGAKEVKDYYESHRNEFPQPLDDAVTIQIRQRLASQRDERERRHLIQRLRDGAKIEIVEGTIN